MSVSSGGIASLAQFSRYVLAGVLPLLARRLARDRGCLREQGAKREGTASTHSGQHQCR